MHSSLVESTRHTLTLAPTHVRQQRPSLKKAARRKTIAHSVPTLATGSFAHYQSLRHQRSIVKVSYAKNTPTRSWAAHGEYLQREHAQQRDEKGLGFNQLSEAVDLKLLLRVWQSERDEHVFKLIVSPENGHQLNLKNHAKELIACMEHDLQTKLQWAAIDHYNTDHPHLHILIRGRDERGETLTLEPDYLFRGIRHRSQELATRVLGLRLDRDRVLARARQVEREYVTEIDRSLRHQAVNSLVNFTRPVPDNQTARELRLLQISRLQFLEKLGLAQKVGKKEWQLSDKLEATLRELQLSNDIIKSRARHNIQTFTHEMPAPTHIQEHQPLTGKVVGMGLEEELQDRRYLLLEGIDGKVHYIQATNSIVKARDNYELANGNVITLHKQRFVTRDFKTIDHLEVKNHQSLQALERAPSARLDHDVIHFVQTQGIAPTLHFPTHSFAQEYAHAMAKRFQELVNEKVIIQEHAHHRLAADWQRQLARAVKEREEALQRERTHYLGEHPLGKRQSHHLKLSR